MSGSDTIDLRHEIKRCPECNEKFRPDAGFCPFDGSLLVPDRYALPTRDPLVGTVVDGRYQIVKVLGEGGMGTVYEVRHVTLGRSAALKVLRADLAQEPELSARFLQEAQATAAIKHSGVVTILDFGRVADGRPYFAMELLTGQTLADAIHNGGPAPIPTAVAIAVKIADALGAAHAAGIVHRDLKPENVYLVGAMNENPDVRVVDFGAAVILGRSRLTKKGVVFGTPHYMAPEQAAGKAIDHRTDVYALGIILYEMITGKVPFEGDTYMGILTQHMFAEPAPPSRIRPERADELGILEAVVLRALAKEPSDRFASMTDLGVALQAALVPGRREARTDPPLLPRKPSQARPHADEHELPTTSEIENAIADAEAPRGRPWLRAVAVGALAAAACIIVIAIVLRRTQSHDGTSATAAASSVVTTTPTTLGSVESTTTTHKVAVHADVAAQLYFGAALVGPLPAEIAFENGTPAKIYTVRATGFVAQDVLVDAQSPSSIDVHLVREAKPSTASTASHAGGAATATSTPTATATTKHTGSDLYDPWK
jgi:eukaryotic-like serine/threonine-protein kinase